jgi:hypothetical protein
MEDIMNFPCFREGKMICNVREFSGYPKGSIPPW